MIGIFKVFDGMQLRKQLGSEHQPSQQHDVQAAGGFPIVYRADPVHAGRVAETGCYIITF
jgi:hypothetical protein